MKIIEFQIKCKILQNDDEHNVQLLPKPLSPSQLVYCPIVPVEAVLVEACFSSGAAFGTGSELIWRSPGNHRMQGEGRRNMTFKVSRKCPPIQSQSQPSTKVAPQTFQEGQIVCYGLT